MSSRLLLALIASLLMAAPASTSFAQDDGSQEDPEPEVSTPNPWERFLALQVTGGLDTPFGVAGAAIELTPVQYLGIYAGGGIGRSGGRFAGGLHPRIPMGNGALGLMVGVAGGPLEWYSRGQAEETRVRRYWDLGIFLHSGLTLEYRWDSGLFGRFAFGAEALVSGEAPDEYTPPGAERIDCSEMGDACAPGAGLGKPVRGWVGLTIGYALDL